MPRRGDKDESYSGRGAGSGIGAQVQSQVHHRVLQGGDGGTPGVPGAPLGDRSPSTLLIAISRSSRANGVSRRYMEIHHVFLLEIAATVALTSDATREQTMIQFGRIRYKFGLRPSSAAAWIFLSPSHPTALAC